jgi:hypothetical protein
MRAQVLLQRLPSGDLSFRVCEADRELVSRWLPLEPFLGALDRGRFSDYADAASFALGIERIRAERGLLRDRGRGRPSLEPADPPLFEAA